MSHREQTKTAEALESTIFVGIEISPVFGAYIFGFCAVGNLSVKLWEIRCASIVVCVK